MGYVQAFIAFVCGEIVGILLFPILTHYLGPQNASAWDIKAILKGVLERLVLFSPRCCMIILRYPNRFRRYEAW